MAHPCIYIQIDRQSYGGRYLIMIDPVGDGKAVRLGVSHASQVQAEYHLRRDADTLDWQLYRDERNKLRARPGPRSGT